MKYIKNGAVITLITLILLCIIEVGLRIFWSAPEKPKPKANPKTLIYKFDSEYLIDLKPNMEKVFQRHEENGGDVINWKTNQFGFRGKETKKNSKLDVMVFGDSNVQARFSKLSNTFCGKLEKYLQDTIQDSVNVVNASVLAFGPDQSFLKMQKMLEEHQPDIVIMHIFADNDYGDLIRNRLFELDDNQHLSRTTFPVEVDQEILPYEEPFTFRTQDFVNSVRAKLQQKHEKTETQEVTKEKTSQQLIDQYLVWCDKEMKVYNNKEERTFSHFADHYDMDVALFPNSDAAITKKRLMHEVIKSANAYAKSKNTQFITLIQPSTIDITRNFSISFDDLSTYEGYMSDNLTAPIEEACKKHQIPHVNFYKLFKENEPDQLYFVGGDNHWNDRGQDLAAQTVANYITTNFPLSK